MFCERCGRLLNRVTGKCVCERGDVRAPVSTVAVPQPATPPAMPGAGQGEAATPVAPAAPTPIGHGVTAPVGAPAPPALSGRMPAPAAPAPAPPVGLPPRAVPPPPGPAPAPTIAPPSAFTEPFVAPTRVARGVIAGTWVRRKGRFDVVVYDEAVALAKVKGRGSGRLARLSHLSPGQVANLHHRNEFVPVGAITDVDVWERPTGGKATLRSGEETILSFSWLGLLNRHVDVSRLFTDAMPKKFELVRPGLGRRAARVAFGVAGAVVAVVILKLGLGAVLRQDPPPPPPAPPPTTVPPSVQTARAELAEACPAWSDFSSGVPSGTRPDPSRLRPVVDAMRPRFDAAAAAEPSLAPAVAELSWLQEYARRPVQDTALESVARIGFALRQIDAACAFGGNLPS